jgi:hypothetical protein
MRYLLAVSLCACGPTFVGHWTGSFELEGGCTDGSGGFENDDVDWTISESESTLTIEPRTGTCGSFTADAQGDYATLEQKSCPPSTQSTLTLQSGTVLVTSAGLLMVCLDLSNIGTGGGVCRSHMSGTLSR